MKKGFTCGVFDLFHSGHALMLKECKENCDYLILAINKADNLPKGKNIPVYSIDERITIMESCKYVDEIYVYNSEEELLKILKEKDIDIRFLGEDYKTKPITGPNLDIEIFFIKRDHGFSSSSIIEKITANHKKK